MGYKIAASTYKLVKRRYTNPKDFTKGIVDEDIAVADRVIALQEYCKDSLKQDCEEPLQVRANVDYYIITHSKVAFLIGTAENPLREREKAIEWFNNLTHKIAEELAYNKYARAAGMLTGSEIETLYKANNK